MLLLWTSVLNFIFLILPKFYSSFNIVIVIVQLKQQHIEQILLSFSS
jgi:hypothetical protein